MKKAEDKYAVKKKRIERIYKFLHVLLCKKLVSKFNLVPEKGQLPKGANLILSNHVTSADQFLVAWYYGRNHIHFVAGENAFKVPFFRWLIVNCMGAIIHMRGVSSLNTIKEMTQNLKRGGNVCIFPEGATTFDGRTEQIDASIAKVAKMSGANLVLMRIEGGYFAKPRWGVSVRKGPIRISDYVITAEELTKMSAKEITEAINERLYVDAYRDGVTDGADASNDGAGAAFGETDGLAARMHIKYPGKSLCKGLECCIYECPACGKITGLTTDDTTIKCKCGFEAEYNEYGYLVEKNASDTIHKQYTISELCDAQKQHLIDIMTTATGASKDDDAGETDSAGEATGTEEADENIFLFEDSLECKRLYSDGRREDRGRVKVRVYTDHIEYENCDAPNDTKNIRLSEIGSLFIFLRNTMNCRVSGREYVYELQGDFSFNALKYRDLYDILQALKKR